MCDTDASCRRFKARTGIPTRRALCRITAQGLKNGGHGKWSEARLGGYQNEATSGTIHASRTTPFAFSFLDIPYLLSLMNPAFSRVVSTRALKVVANNRPSCRDKNGLTMFPESLCPR